MASLTLDDIPSELLERLNARARCEGRSAGAEALRILERAMSDYRTPEERAETSRVLVDIGDASEGLFEWDVDAIYAARTYGRDVEL